MVRDRFRHGLPWRQPLLWVRRFLAFDYGNWERLACYSSVVFETSTYVYERCEQRKQCNTSMFTKPKNAV